MSTAPRRAARSRPSPSPDSTLYAVPTRVPITRQKPRSARPLAVVPPSAQPTKVRRFPSTQRSLPLWLRLLVRVQRSSLIAAVVLVIAALVLYGSTVYTQQLWSREYNKLKTMQRNERQLTTTSEALKHQLAQQAERPNSGLIPRTPANTLFLQPAPPRPAPPVQSAPQPQSTASTPLGY
ncbi:hypothetical protein [Leptolyngbya sp. FACHB-36]|uniref:hypothetical protein n=1 Tax=Leptolyngbya sp. FACHB-36 TaxID=2692808 RepID=UPI0018EFDEDD|nr:hypothetical protein [Leptolyngbya sp. FACHB-36]